MFLSPFISFIHKSFIGKKGAISEKLCLGIGKTMCWVSLCLWLFKIVVWILSANCLYDTPTWVFNMHIKLHLPKVELLVTPQPTKNLLSHLPGCSRKTPRVILNSLLSLSPQPICWQFLLILLPKCVTECLSSPHHCCYLPVHSPSFLFWTTAQVFWPVSMLLVIYVLPSSKNHLLKVAHPHLKSFPCLKSWVGFPR